MLRDSTDKHKIGNQQYHYKLQINNFTTRTEAHEGHNHLVVPTVMLIEGVHSGSGGAHLHIEDELSKYVEIWNGIPVVVPHPSDKDGNPMSANKPDIVDTAVGRIFNSEYMDGKLKAEIWFDDAILLKYAPNILEDINNNRPIEVSTGYFADLDDEKGAWGGDPEEEYIGIVRNYRPDHLAILPNAKGACSYDDGCGIRANQNNCNDSSVEVTGESIPVEHVETNIKKGVKTMNEKKKPCCPEKIGIIIQSEYTRFEEADREWLEGLDEAQVIKLLPIEPEQTQVQINQEQAIQALKETISTPEQFLSLLPVEMKAQMQHGLHLFNEEKGKLVSAITTNSNAFTADELNAKDLNELKKLVSLIPSVGNYAPLSGGRNIDVNEVKPLEVVC